MFSATCIATRFVGSRAKRPGNAVTAWRCDFRCHTKSGITTRWLQSLVGAVPHDVSLPDQRAKIALLVDCDQVGPKAFKPLVAAVAVEGEIILSRAYVTEAKAVEWAKPLADAGIDAVVVPRVAGGAKSPVDIEIAIDAAELALGPWRHHISSIAIASNDLDFMLVLKRFRYWGIGAYLAVEHDGMHAVPLAFRSAVQDVGAKLIGYALMGGKRRPRLKIILQDGTSTVEYCDHPLTPEHLRTEAEHTLVKDTLTRLGYLPEGYKGPEVPAVAKFFHFNNLGPLVVFPFWFGMNHIAKVLSSAPDRQWIPDQESLVYIEPEAVAGNEAARKRAGTDNAARFAGAGGPFLAKISANLVHDVLERLQFLEPCGNQLEAAQYFCDLNAKRLRDCGVDLTQGDKISILHATFANRTIRQNWKIARKHAHLYVVDILCKEGLLIDRDATREAVRLAVVRFFELRRHGDDALPSSQLLQGKQVTAASNYFEAVNQILTYMGRSTSDIRK